MKKLLYLLLFIFITITAKSEILENMTMTEILQKNYTISDKIIPEPFEGSVYFVLSKERKANKELNSEELADYIDRIKIFDLSNENNSQYILKPSDLYYETEIILCKVSIEITKCKKT